MAANFAAAAAAPSDPIPGLYALVFHWAGDWHRRFFRSQQAAEEFMATRDFLTRVQAPRASRVLLDPQRSVIRMHVAGRFM